MSDTNANNMLGDVAESPEVKNEVLQTGDGTSSELNAVHDLQDVGNAADGNPEKKEHTRSKMAILFVLGFFAILFLCFVYGIMVNATLGDLKDTLVGVIGALSGILGFIVGYYYKSSQEQ